MIPTRDKEFEMETRVVVMDFMALVPLSCPPTSAFFKPFTNSQEDAVSEFDFDESFVNNNRKNADASKDSRSIRARCHAPRRISSARGPHIVPLSRRFKQSNSFRTIIRKNDKFVVLEDTEEYDRASSYAFDDRNATEIVSAAYQESAKPTLAEPAKQKKLELSINVNAFNPSKSSHVSSTERPHIANAFFKNNNDVTNREKCLDNSHDYGSIIGSAVPFDGTSVDHRPINNVYRTFSRFLSHNKENLYIDINKVVALEQLVDNGDISPLAVPLQSELKGLRLNEPDNAGNDILISPTHPPLSPTSEVADTLRAIADKVQEEYAHELDSAVGKLVNFEEGKRLTFEVLKEVVLELMKDISPGWSRVVLPLVLSQTLAMALLMLGNRSIVGKLVDFTTRLLCNDVDEFVVKKGGWDAVKESGFREVPMLLEDFPSDD